MFSYVEINNTMATHREFSAVSVKHKMVSCAFHPDGGGLQIFTYEPLEGSEVLGRK